MDRITAVMKVAPVAAKNPVLRIVTQVPDDPQPLGIGSGKNQAALLPAVNSALAAMRSTLSRQISRRFAIPWKRVSDMSAENDIRKASDKFYAALDRTINGDANTDGGCVVTKLRRFHTAPYRWKPSRLGRGPRIVGKFKQDLLEWIGQTD